jgi:cytochrome bd-type quinol oxidase subunit 2
MTRKRALPSNPILSLLASSAGVSGLLVVVGFFIQQGLRSMIGVSARLPGDVTSYLIDVAYFVEDTLGSLFDHAKEIVIALIVIAAIVAAGYLLVRLLKKKIDVPPFARQRGVLVAAVLLTVFVKLFFIDWPVIVISDFFRRSATETSSGDTGILGSTTETMWLNLLRAHDADKTIHREGRSKLEDAYAMYVFLAAIIIVACLALLRAKRDDVEASVLVCVAIMQLLLTAYTYGKFERSTFYPCVELTLREPATPTTQKAFMMSDDSQSVTVFNALDDRFHRWSWSEIRQITLIGEEDVLGAHLLATPPAATKEQLDRLAARKAQLRSQGRLPRCLE